jgi:hypothetical protein
MRNGRRRHPDRVLESEVDDLGAYSEGWSETKNGAYPKRIREQSKVCERGQRRCEQEHVERRERENCEVAHRVG